MNSESKRKKILFISAGATVTGVPVFFINMIAWFKRNADFEITILTAFNGPLENEYKKLAPTFRWDGSDESSNYLIRLSKRIVKKVFRINERSYKQKIISILTSENFDLIYINSVCSLWIFEEIREFIKCKTLLHVHELQMSILQFCGEDTLKRNIQYCDRVIVISKAVEANLIKEFKVPERLMTEVYTFVDIDKSGNVNPLIQRNIIRDQLGIPPEAFVVSSSGTTDWRKGADLVVRIAKKVISKTDVPVHFIWIGGDNTGLEYQKLKYDIVRLNLQERVHFLGVRDNLLEYLAASDIFMLCSREEPVGIVALEAATLEKPVLCFEQAGGIIEFVEDDCGFIVPYLDLDSMADRIICLQKDRPLLNSLGKNAAQKVKRHDINIACRGIESVINSVLAS